MYSPPQKKQFPFSNAGGNVSAQVWSVFAGGNATTFTYDANGNTLTRIDEPGSTWAATGNYTWDGMNRLLSVVKPYPAAAGSTQVSFVYDGQGRQRQILAQTWDTGNSTWDTTAAENLLWDGNQLVQLLDGSNNILQQYYGNGFETVGGGNVTGNYFYTRDHLGSVREVVGGAGSVAGAQTLEGRYSYGPWGETTYMDYSGGAVPQPGFGYAGYYQTAYLPNEYLAVNRIYDPSTRRWLSRDPIGEQGGLNLYGYAGNDPIDNLDPSGLWTAEVYGGAVLGGYFSFGYNNGHFSWRLGVGGADGFSASFDPNNQPNESGLAPGALQIGVIGRLDVGAGIAGAGIGGEASLSVDNCDTHMIVGNAQIGMSGSFLDYQNGGGVGEQQNPDTGTWTSISDSGGQLTSPDGGVFKGELVPRKVSIGGFFGVFVGSQ